MKVVGEDEGQLTGRVQLERLHWSLNNELVMGRHMDRWSASESICRLPKTCRRLLE
jgi:hypothetical protein